MAVRVRWRGLELPFQVIVDKQSLTSTHGEFTAEPFERGFGHTVGNSLRRVLLSSIEGAAVIGARIKGVSQELTALDGVLEDIPEILLNLKEVVLKVYPDEEKQLHLVGHGKGPVRAGDIEPDSDVEVVNPGRLIATLTDAVDFECTLTVRKGRGYVPSEELNLDRTVGFLPVDALFSPVQKVSYTVADTRVGRRTNYDRLLLSIDTNGAVSPEMALVEAAKILRKHLNPFVEYFELSRRLPQEAPEPIPEVKHLEEPEIPESKLSMPLAALDLSARASNCLKNIKAKTVRDLLRISPDDLLKVRNLGKVTMDELGEKLAEQGLEIGQLAAQERQPEEEQETDEEE
ncbi:MAG: DNA-directed RNA polymerase subunit alpha [Planctomycetes bacterium]|nr:DNA-directed RNA polymerase subunit alpha [Planctomycetota bacterium]